MTHSGKLALILFLAGISGTTVGAEKKMTLAEVVSGAIQRVTGPTESIEDFLQAPENRRRMPPGAAHPRIDYKTRDGVLLHIELASERQNTAMSAVTRVVLGVDDSQCVVAEKFKADLDSREAIAWTSVGNNAGWSSRVNGLFVSISKRTGHCLAAVIADVMKIRAVPINVHRLASPDGTIHASPLGH